MVEVGRAENAPSFIHNHNFGVDHRWLILENLRTSLQQMTAIVMTDPPNCGMVDVRSSNQNANLDAALAGLLQRMARAAIGQEIRRGDHNIFLCTLDESLKQDASMRAAAAGRTGDNQGWNASMAALKFKLLMAC